MFEKLISSLGFKQEKEPKKDYFKELQLRGDGCLISKANGDVFYNDADGQHWIGLFPKLDDGGEYRNVTPSVGKILDQIKQEKIAERLRTKIVEEAI